ncbi:MAG: glycosyltransferase [Candidatus Binatia bacterium]
MNQAWVRGNAAPPCPAGALRDKEAKTSRRRIATRSRALTARHTELTVLLPVLNERENLSALLPRLARVLGELGCASEVLVVDGGSRDGTVEAAQGLGARVLVQREPGYGGALREAFAAAAGQFLLTLDADLSHDPDFIVKLWRARTSADVVIASRYVKGGVAYMPLGRKVLSRVLNRFFAIGLGLPVRDLSSGFRLYRAAVLADLDLHGRNFDILEEVLVKAYAQGWRVVEVPFTYYPRDRGASHARIVRFGLDLLRSFLRLWKLRSSIESADYDERAFYSRIPLQRHWQRRRHRIITAMARGAGRTLDVGCGSSVILQSLNNAVGLDVLANKLRYMRQYGVPLVRGSVTALPVRDGRFDCVVCSQVIEHLPADPVIFDELIRVLRPGGLLILGTPDYDTVGWRTIEPLYGVAAPGGYKDEHITHYTRASLSELAARHGLEIVEHAYVYRSELIMAMRKPVRADTTRVSSPFVVAS